VALPNLTRDDARVRAELLDVDSYDVVLDLTDGGG
jgi:aminopeptidase N